MMVVNQRRENGITLIALVITVIILLILAGVAMSLITGQNGLFARANHAGYKYDIAAQEEKDKYDVLDAALAQYVPGVEDPSTPITYTIVYNANGGTGNMDEQPMTYGTSANLAANAFTKTEMVFLEWNSAPDGSGRSYTNGQPVNNLTNTDGGTFNLYAQWGTPQLKYAVQIYGINQDEDASGNTLGLSFGPATGANYNDAYVTHTYEPNGNGGYNVLIVTHTVNNGVETISTEYLTKLDGENRVNVTRTENEKNKYNVNLHDMTWAEIAAVSDKTIFTDCMLCGDTKSVKVTLNDTIKDSSTSIPIQNGDGAGVLQYLITSYYKKWNPTSSDNEAAINGGTDGSNARNAGGYSSSHIRATLIGVNTKTDITYAGDINLTSENCLYSCIDSELKNLIKAKKIKYVTGTSQSDYTLNSDIADVIWLFSERELNCSGYGSGGTTEGVGQNGDGYGVFTNVESKFYKAGFETRMLAYNEQKTIGWWWLRSLSLIAPWYAKVVQGEHGNSDGWGYVDYSGFGFGFCI